TLFPYTTLFRSPVTGADVIHPVRDRLGHPAWEVVAVDRHRLTRGLPLPAVVGILTHQLLLLTVHAHHRVTGIQEPLHGGVDVTELGIPIRMLRTLFRLEHRLQPVPRLLQ